MRPTATRRAARWRLLQVEFPSASPANVTEEQSPRHGMRLSGPRTRSHPRRAIFFGFAEIADRSASSLAYWTTDHVDPRRRLAKEKIGDGKCADEASSARLSADGARG